MKLYEMFNQPVQGYQDLGGDNSRVRWADARKTKLTLRQIRKLRKMHDVRNYERSRYLEKVRNQYQPAQQAPAF